MSGISNLAQLVMTVAVAALSVGSAYADKPEWAGKGKHGKSHAEQEDRGRDERRHGGLGFDGDTRRIVADYYGTQFRSGNCPPGLAKKNNGCLPPGQAKKWSKGKPLPHGIDLYDLPRDLYGRLPPPPPNHRYVRVAADILLIAAGTQMVIDAVEDIGRH